MSRADELEEELYCPICGDMFEDPLMLPCTHSFCRACLQEQINKGQVKRKCEYIQFDCPVCRKTVTLDDLGLGGLPKNRLLQKMVDAYKGRRRRKTKTAAEDSRRCLGYCEEHEGRELGAFCSACREVVCIDCVVGRHKSHAIEAVEEVYNRKRKAIESQIALLEGELQTLGSAEAEEYTYMEQIKDQCKEKSAALELQFDEYLDLLRQSRDSVLAELAARQHQEVGVVRASLGTIHKSQARAEETLATLREKLKLDMAALLKDKPLEQTEHHSRPRKGQRSSKKSEDQTTSVAVAKSPRTRCFTECTLELDGAGLETIINTAHLVWEQQTDQFSPKHLADRFTELFEKDWKATFSESAPKPKDDTITQLLAILMDAYQQAETSCETHLESLTYHMLQPDIDVQVANCCTIHTANNTQETESTNTTASFCGVKESLRKLRAAHASSLTTDTVFMMHHETGQLSASLGQGNYRHQLSLFAHQCFEVCHTLLLQDPPLYIQTDMDLDMVAETHTDNYKFVKRKGRKSKIVVWPPLHLYKGGPVIAKGVVFMPMTAVTV